MPTTQLGELERELMVVLWSGTTSLTGRQIHSAVSRERFRAYTTVMTVLSRLVSKGLVRRERDGIAWRFTPTMSREEYSIRLVRSALDALEAEGMEESMSRLLQAATPSELAALRAALG